MLVATLPQSKGEPESGVTQKRAILGVPLVIECTRTNDQKSNNPHYACISVELICGIVLKDGDAEILGHRGSQGQRCTTEGDVAVMGQCGIAVATLLCWGVEGGGG